MDRRNALEEVKRKNVAVTGARTPTLPLAVKPIACRYADCAVSTMHGISSRAAGQADRKVIEDSAMKPYGEVGTKLLAFLASALDGGG
jgi:hypothetical protein